MLYEHNGTNGHMPVPLLVCPLKVPLCVAALFALRYLPETLVKKQKGGKDGLKSKMKSKVRSAFAHCMHNCPLHT
jgi:hypothetical protein